MLIAALLFVTGYSDWFWQMTFANRYFGYKRGKDYGYWHYLVASIKGCFCCCDERKTEAEEKEEKEAEQKGEKEP